MVLTHLANDHGWLVGKNPVLKNIRLRQSGMMTATQYSWENAKLMATSYHPPNGGLILSLWQATRNIAMEESAKTQPVNHRIDWAMAPTTVRQRLWSCFQKSGYPQSSSISQPGVTGFSMKYMK